MIVDTHCHLENNIKSDLKIKKMATDLIIVSGYNKKSNEEVIELCKKYDNVYGTIGIHPEELDSYNKENIKFIEDNLLNKKIVGIGEIGLDYHYTKENKDKQKELFILFLSLARKYNKPVVIHSRDAIKDTYDILSEYKDLKKVLHCYSGSLEMANEFIKINCLLGVNGVVTFKNANQIKEVVKNISIDNLLLETDSPYLTPEPYRGLENEPHNVYIVAQEISNIKGIRKEEVIDITTKNAIKLFDLPK